MEKRLNVFTLLYWRFLLDIIKLKYVKISSRYFSIKRADKYLFNM